MKKRAWIIWLSLAVFAATLLGVTHYYEYVVWKNFGVVEEGRIYRSGRLKPHQLKKAIGGLRLASVVNLAHQTSSRADQEEEAIVRKHGLHYFMFKWPKHGNVSEAALQEVYKIVSDAENQPVLLHCARGISRTGLAVAYYRYRSTDWSAQEICKEMGQYNGRTPRKEQLVQGWFSRQNLY